MNEKIYKKWVDNYSKEHEMLNFLNENYYPRALNEMCFHGQQIIEKVLKSHLVLHDRKDRLYHHDVDSLALLVNQIEGKEIFTQNDLKAFGAITRFAVNTRYPNDYPCTEDDLDLVLRYCKKTRDIIEEISREYIKQERSVDKQIKDAERCRSNVGDKNKIGGRDLEDRF